MHGRELSGGELARLVDEFVNGSSDADFQNFAEHMVSRVHRTLQQKTMGLFMRTIEAWAALPENYFDGRNEATVRLSRKIITATGDKYDRYLPLI